MTHRHHSLPPPLLLCCTLLGGAAALIYQVAWTRQLEVLFGTADLATAVVLAVYMSGLAFGALSLSRWQPEAHHALRWYAAAEFGIAVLALLWIPLAMRGLNDLLILLFGQQSTPPGNHWQRLTMFYGLTGGLLLLPPTALMGATLPLLIKRVCTPSGEATQARRVTYLYALNTTGAIVGALLSALWLLPRFGLHTTLQGAALLNMLAALLALVAQRTPLASNAPAHDFDPLATTPSVTPALAAQQRSALHRLLLVMFCAGAITFMHEVVWTRIVSHIIGSSLFAIGVMLACFLAGILLGALLARRFLRDAAQAARALALSQLATAIMTMLAWWWLQRLSVRIDTLLERLAFSSVLLLPLATTLGMSYPLAVRWLVAQHQASTSAAARIYTWNTLGAVLGALGTALWWLPALRYEGMMQVMVLASVVLAVLSAYWLLGERRPAALLMLVGLMLVTLFRPPVPENLLRYSSLHVNGEGELLSYATGRHATVVTLRQQDQLAMRTQGLPEAEIEARGAVPQRYVEAWMAPLAVLARPQSQRMLVIGLGGGRVLEATPPNITHMDVIELEPAVTLANQQLRAERRRNPLADPRVNLIHNDARNALLLSRQQYDVIVSQPSHPWTAGASHLYTHEFMSLVREHLSNDGVFVQWMNVEFLDESLLRSLLATMAEVFPALQVYRPAPTTLLLLGALKPLDASLAQANARQALQAAPLFYAQLGIRGVEDVLAALALDDARVRALAKGAALITDDRNRFASISVYDLGQHLSGDALGRQWLALDPLSSALQVSMNAGRTGNTHEDEMRLIDWQYLATRITAHQAWDGSARQRVYRLAQQVNPERRALLQALNGRDASAQQASLLLAAAQAFPNDSELVDAAVEPWLNELVLQQAPDDIRVLAAKLSAHGQTVLAATRLATTQGLAAVYALDAELAAIPMTSVWYGQALQLRVDARWARYQMSAQRDALYEALALIDVAAVDGQTPHLLALRAALANAVAQADQHSGTNSDGTSADSKNAATSQPFITQLHQDAPYLALESAIRFCQLANQRVDSEIDQQRSAWQQDLDLVQSALVTVVNEERLPIARREQTWRACEQTQQRLSTTS